MFGYITNSFVVSIKMKDISNKKFKKIGIE